MPVIDELALNERDIDILATDMKENLRLSKRSVNRYLPYSRRDVRESLSVRILRKAESKKSSTQDPYDMLQELLNKRCLIQEAVKRLQLGPPKLNDDNECLEECGKLVKDDSEDDNLTPLRSIP